MGWQTSYSWALASNIGAGISNWRMVIAANAASYDGTKIRLTVEASSASNAVVTGASIGVSTATGEFDAEPTRITWDTGNNGCTVTAGQEKLSDEMTFSFDKTKRHIIHIYTTDMTFRLGNVGDVRYYKNVEVDYTMDLVIPPTLNNDTTSCGTKLLEVYEELDLSVNVSECE